MYESNDLDDDIFDDTKSLSDSSANANSSNSSESFSNSNSDKEEFDNLFDRILGIQKDKEGVSILSNLVLTFYDSVARWIEDGYEQVFYKSTYAFNDHLISNKAKPFPLYEKYYASQHQVSKRRIVSIFLKEFLDNRDQIENISKKLKLDITEEAIAIYFGSFYNINQYAILDAFVHYKTTAQYLGLPFDDSVMFDLPNGSVYGPQPYEHFSHNAFALVVDEDFSKVLADNLKEAINEFVKIKEED